ncbi:MAG: sugar MFS transporter [Arenicella sp.]|nr:sugar MFS transporter [Arenicella sp.]
MSENISSTHQNSILPMIIIGSLFFMFGFVTWLNGSLIPFLQIACELENMQAYLVTMIFYLAYTIVALPSSMILRRTGYKNGMLIGMVIMAIGALLFVPAALTRLYPLFLLALFVLGAGLTLLQTASNPYVVLIGSRETAAVRISLMGVLNKAAGVIAPIIFTAFVLTDMAQYSDANLAVLSTELKSQQLVELSVRLVNPYLIMAGMLLVLAVFLKMAPLPEPVVEESDQSPDDGSTILSHPQLVLGAITLFFYVGAEVIAGDTIGLFGKDLGVSNFGELTSYTMSFMVVGYLLGMLLIPRWVSQQMALVGSALLGILFSVLLVTASQNDSSIWALLFSWTGVPAIPDAVLYVALFGLSNAMVWPAIWPLALNGLNARLTSTGSALLIMAISGGAVLPVIYGALADSYQSAQQAYLLMIPFYLFILFYGLKGHKMKAWK